MDEWIQKFFGFLFLVIATLVGMWFKQDDLRDRAREAWRLRDDEKAELSKDAISLLESLPDSIFEKLEEWLSASLPPMALLYGLGGALMPRIAATNKLLAEDKAVQ